MTPTLYDIWAASNRATATEVNRALDTLGVVEMIHVEDVDGRIVIGFMRDGSIFADAEPMPAPSSEQEPPILMEIVGRLVKMGRGGGGGERG